MDRQFLVQFIKLFSITCFFILLLNLICCVTAKDKPDTNSPSGKKTKIYIIVHKDNPTSTITISELKRIFLGTQSRWSNSVNITRYDYPPAQQIFYEQVLQIPMSEVHRYWTQQKIMGGYHPPVIIKRLRDIFPIFQREIGSIGYVNSKNIPKDIKILAEFEVSS